MYILRIEFMDGSLLEKTAAYNHQISFWLFDSWQRRNDVIRVELRDNHARVIALADKAADVENEDSGQEERSYYDDGPSRFEDSPRYRADMIDAGRGRLLR